MRNDLFRILILSMLFKHIWKFYKKICFLLMHCWGYGMIYSGSSFEFFDFRIQAKVPDLCKSSGFMRIRIQPILFKYRMVRYMRYMQEKHLKFNNKKRIFNYLPFSIFNLLQAVDKKMRSLSCNRYRYPGPNTELI